METTWHKIKTLYGTCACIALKHYVTGKFKLDLSGLNYVLKKLAYNM